MRYKSSIIILLLIIFSISISYFIPQLKMENSENRTLATFEMVFNPQEDSVVYHESPVERLNAAMSDQFAYREIIIKRYLNIFNKLENYTFNLRKIFLPKKDNQYNLYTIGNYELIEDTGYLTTRPKTNKFNENVLNERIKQLDYIKEKYPQISIYAYYVTQAYDTSWFNYYLDTNAIDHYKELEDILPSYIKLAQLKYHDLNDYMDIHYKTDHHWNHKGAYRGYEDIYDLMKDDFDLTNKILPKEEIEISKIYNFNYVGSYARALGELYKYDYDDFSFYLYDYPEYEYYVIDTNNLEEIKVDDIGLENDYLEGNIDNNDDHYIIMHGTAKDNNQEYHDNEYPFVIYNKEAKNNLLICGDSYARSIRDNLASHFNKTIYIDYRILKKIPLDYIIEKYEIDALLICSNTSMWNNKDYLFTFRSEK